MADPRDVLGLARTPPHDYDQVQSTRWRAPRSPLTVTVLTGLLAFTVGFLITTGMSAGRGEAVAQLERKDELIGLIIERQEHADELGAELDELRARVDAAQDTAAEGVPALQAEIARVEIAAGMVALRGSGVRLTFHDSPDCPPSDFVCRIHDADIQLAVNALFGAGAEAVSVGGERVTANTAIRSAGQSILANFTVLSEPYVVEAIGDPRQMRTEFEASSFAAQFARDADNYGLEMDVEEVAEVEVPRFSGSLRMDARPAGGASAAER